jgi:hypothetical protein
MDADSFEVELYERAADPQVLSNDRARRPRAGRYARRVGRRRHLGEEVFTALLARTGAEGDLDRVVAVDSTIVRAHQHAAGARQEGPRPVSRTTMPSDGPAAG